MGTTRSDAAALTSADGELGSLDTGDGLARVSNLTAALTHPPLVGHHGPLSTASGLPTPAARSLSVRLPGMDETVRTYLQGWLEVQRTQLQPSTWREYEGNTRRYLVHHLGARRVNEISHRDLTALYRILLTTGGVRGKPLALVTVQRISAMVHKVFADAVRDDLITANPADKALLPRVDLSSGPHELRVWTAPQLTAFLERERHRPLWPLWVVAAGTGMRRGELLGLRWVDVDEATATIHVRRALSLVSGVVRLKTPKSNRFRSLHVGPEVLGALRLTQDRQQAQAELPGRDAAEPASRTWGLVFTEPDGGHLRPQKVTDTWREAVRDSKQPLIRFHDIRHSHATLLLQAGVSPHVVSTRLGHASITTTLDLYAEVLPAMDEDAATRFEQHVWGAAADQGTRARTTRREASSESHDADGSRGLDEA